MKKLFVFIFILQLIIFINPSYAKTTIDTYSPSVILMDSNTGKILYEKNSKEIRYPASTTKIMTAILTAEKCNLTDTATVSHNAIFSVPPSYSHASLKEGEVLTIENLLNVLLIPSANDAANVLAEHIGGSIEDFAKLMNEKAKEIGCLNTNFLNPSGIHNEKHKTTAYDLALMGQYAMKNDVIRNIVCKTSYSLPATNKYSKTDRKFNTTNDLIRKNNSNSKDNYYYKNAMGVKTGYTTEAGSCIISSAKKGDMEVIAVVLGGSSTADGLSQRNLDCINLFDFAFENYSYKTLHEPNGVVTEIKIDGASKETENLKVIAKDKISVLLNNDDSIENLNPEIVINEDLKAPILANSVIGKISYEINDTTYSSELLAQSNVEPSNIGTIIFHFILIIITLYLLYLMLKPSDKNNNGTKKFFDKNKVIKNKKKGGHFKFTYLQ